ncbi:hypothetical protein CFC21_033328 [Triticum aestivum]|uniref:NB-ARC domain-containing protein n=3 Tax=Triticum aestivum TaxID=4565 RepID=A0A9R1F1N6_WHEAT|nr:hypothetical protein CFC21_033328 [Triticum aestivum]
MELGPISASLGAMRSLPRKLHELLATKHRILRGIVMDEIEQLTADLRIQYSFMLVLSTAQDPAMSARYWMKDVRELSYDMEDFADQFIQAHGRSKIFSLKRRHHAHGRAKIRRAILRKLIYRMKDMGEPSYDMVKFVDQFIHAHGRAKIRRATCRKLVSRLKISRLPGRRRWRSWITNMVSEFRTRAQEATRRCQRYKLDDCVSNSGYSRIGHELPTMLQDPSDLVGIEDAMDELERWLTDGKKPLKVASIVGVGGIGKTTLAQKLWGKLHVQFECGAFVRTAQKPDMRGILRNILLQVRPHQPPDAGEMHHLINDLRQYLQGKR